MKINEKIAGIPPSVTLGITSKAKSMSAAGEKVFSFAAGEPDFDTPEHIKKAGLDALAAGHTKYCPVAGLLDLRKAIVEKLQKENNLTYGTDQIIVSNGAKHSLYNIFMALCDTGDEVIIPSPFWLSYPEMVKMAGGTPVFVAGLEENDFKISPEDLKAAITPNTKAIVINSPSNPIGIVYSETELKVLAEIAAENNIYIISDEIYEKLIYDGLTHVSVGNFSKEIFDLTVTVNGFSKAFAMTGWRLGYFAAPKDLAKPVMALQSHSTSGPNTFAQFGGVAALKGPQECVAEMNKAFTGRRDYMYERLAAMDGVSCVRPSGAFYMLPNISSFGMDSISFCEKLLDKVKVAAVPGIAFGADKNIRLSYACSMDNIKNGMDALEGFLGSL